MNGEAIYNSRPWRVQNDTLDGNVWYTMSRDKQLYYGSVLSWPDDNVLRLGAPKLSTGAKVFVLRRGGKMELKWRHVKDVVEIDLPVEVHRGEPAWVIRFQEG